MKRLLFAASLALLQPSCVLAQTRQQRVAVVVDGGDAAVQPVFQKLSKSLQSRAAVSIYTLDQINVSNPIEKGKLLAALETRDLIIAVGDGATEFVTAELEDTPIYFVDAGLVGGGQLSSQLVSGMFSYNSDSLLNAVHALWPGSVGLAYTPGYEPVANWIRQGAAQRNISLAERKISSLSQLAPAIRELLEHARTIWVVGDPLLVRGAGFQFLAERALSQNIPIVAAGLWEVQHGAVMAYQPNSGTTAVQAEKSIDSILNGHHDKTARFEPAPKDGTLLINGTLADKWKISPPTDQQWRLVR